MELGFNVSGSEMDDNASDPFNELLRMEQGLVERLRSLTASLPEGEPYRSLLDRHLRELERIVGQLENLERDLENLGE